MPTSVTDGNVQALGHQARPDQDVEAALGERVDDAFRGSAVLDDVADPAGRLEGPGNVSRTSRSSRSVPPPR